MTYDSDDEKPMTVFTPIIAVFCVIIVFLGVLLVFGFITETGGSDWGFCVIIVFLRVREGVIY